MHSFFVLIICSIYELDLVIENKLEIKLTITGDRASVVESLL